MKQIITLGGGGFSTEPDNLLLDQYILDQSPAAVPKVCFVPTASGDSDTYTSRFYESFEKLPCAPSHLSLFKPPVRDVASFILEKDIIYVGGGNTKNLLALWREWKLDEVMQRAWEKGIVLAGISAGSLCWYEDGVTDSYGDELDPSKRLVFSLAVIVHIMTGKKLRRPRYHELIQSGAIQGGVAADDGVAIHYIGTDIHRVVSSRPGAKAYDVQLVNGSVKEEVLQTKYLGK